MVKIYQGKISTHPKGFAFIKTESGEDFFVPKKYRGSALHGDIVEFEILEVGTIQNPKPVVKVTNIIKRKRDYIVGIVSVIDGKKNIICDDKKINEFIAYKNFRKLKTNHKILFKIINVTNNKIECDFVKYIGHHKALGIDVKSLVASYGVEESFPIEASKETQKTPNQVLESDLYNRIDLRSKKIITIDGAKAKDLDDAIRVKKLKNGNYLLGVYIADVSYYVKPGSAIDQEAYERATSIYLADRVIPMLPENLSNGICSLNPNVDRLVMACEMEIDQEGKTINTKLFQAVINTMHRMTYSDVNAIYDGDHKLKAKYQNIDTLLINAKELSATLMKSKIKEGYLDFDIDESEIIVDKTGKAIDVVLKPRGYSEKMIESFMVKANESVSEEISKLKLPCIYRVHKNPPQDKLREFYKFARHFGEHFEAVTRDVKPKDIQKILDLYKDKSYFFSIAVQLLRSMDKACYDSKNVGHFGLASKAYSHFTSPIRRYPDLILHRLIRDFIFNDSPKNVGYWKDNLDSMCQHTSDRERRAIDIERATLAMKKAEWAFDNKDKEFDAKIVSMIDFGMFIQIPNGVEGLISIYDLLDQEYEYVEATFAMVGKKDKKHYKPGDKIKVFIKNAIKDTGKIDFGLVEFKEQTIANFEQYQKDKQARIRK